MRLGFIEPNIGGGYFLNHYMNIGIHFQSPCMQKFYLRKKMKIHKILVMD